MHLPLTHSVLANSGACILTPVIITYLSGFVLLWATCPPAMRPYSLTQGHFELCHTPPVRVRGLARSLTCMRACPARGGDMSTPCVSRASIHANVENKQVAVACPNATGPGLIRAPLTSPMHLPYGPARGGEIAW